MGIGAVAIAEQESFCANLLVGVSAKTRFFNEHRHIFGNDLYHLSTETSDDYRCEFLKIMFISQI